LKPIRLSAHAFSYAGKRGFSVAEVLDTIQNSDWETAELSRLQSRKDFPYREEWNGKYYTTKQVRPIFIEEEKEIVVVTVYTYYY